MGNTETLASSLFSVIVCPSCRSALEKASSTLVRCTACRQDYEWSSGFLRLAPAPYYWGEIPQERMKQVVKEAGVGRWQDAVSTMLSETGWENGFNNIRGLGRADWFAELPVNNNARVLDIGSGWGQIASLLSERFREVFSLEGVVERAEFQSIRRQQDGLANLVVVNSDITSLPFADASFDAIVMNGVVEWLGLCDLTRNPRDVQVSVLRSVAKLLKPGGSLYVGIENRFSYRSMRGSKDHSGLRYTNLMPRWMANLVVHSKRPDNKRSWRGASAYRTYTYTPRGYRRLLMEAGLSDVTVNWVLPGYNEPLHSANMCHPKPLAWYCNVVTSHASYRTLKRLAARCLLACRLHPLVMPHVSIVSRTSGPRPSSLLDRVCDELRKDGMELDPTRFLRMSRPGPLRMPTGRVHYMGFRPGFSLPVVVLKIPRSGPGAVLMRQEEVVFKRIASRLPELSQSRQVRYMHLDKGDVLCEPWFPGESFRSHLLSEASHDKVLEWLAPLRRAGRSGAGPVCPAQRCRELIETIETKLSVAPKVCDYVRKVLKGLPSDGKLARMPVAAHGDLQSDNIIINAGRIYVTDWEWVSDQATVTFDVWHFLSSNAMRVASDGTLLVDQDPDQFLAALSNRTPYAPILSQTVRKWSTEAEVSLPFMVAGFLETLLARVVRDAERHENINSSLHYQIMYRAARQGFDLWSCLASILGENQATV